MKTKKITLELNEHTFAVLEMLVFGLNKEQPEAYPLKHDKKNDDFAPMVRELLVSVANSLSTGVSRRGSWEASIVDNLTGWDGTYNRGMAADCIADEVAGWSKK